MNNLILFGFKGCGKSHIGSLLAKRLHLPFVDLDHLIEQSYFKQFHAPLSCRQIVLEKGAVFFRQLEKECVRSLKQCTHYVIALGGGTVLDPENVAFLKPLGTLFYLQLDKETLKKRMFAHELPAYIDPDDPEESFENMYYDRKEKYETIGAKTIFVQNRKPEEIIEEIAKSYGK
ncbi:MAG TPA: shikimate kinase [Rhabdochlamydiaceae bacterium]|nr:shikimate kinase [Rhabdochlamydiaceae bacterium]